MEYKELKDLLSKDEKIKKFFDKTRNADIADYDLYEKEFFQEEYGQPILNPGTNTEFWLASLMVRFTQAYSLDRDQLLNEMIEKGELKRIFEKAFPKESGELLVFVHNWMGTARYNLLMKQRRELSKTANKKKQTWKSGDLFLFPTENGQNYFGKIMASLKNCLKGKEKNARKNRLIAFSNYYLVELYTEVSDKKYPAEMKTVSPPLILDDYAFSNGYCENIGHLPVNMSDIDFPENLTTELDEEGKSKGYFVKGELMLPIDESKVKEWPDLFNDDTSTSSYAIDFYVTDFNGSAQQDFDIRLQPATVRNRIYALIDEDPGSTYFDLAKKHGIDTSNYLK